MDEKDVLARVEYIRNIADDDERAHAREDELHQDVLAEIARGIPGPRAWALATAALKTKEIKFARWCA